MCGNATLHGRADVLARRTVGLGEMDDTLRGIALVGKACALQL